MNKINEAWNKFNNNYNKIKLSEWIQFWYIIDYISKKKNNWKLLTSENIDYYLQIPFDKFMIKFNYQEPIDYICNQYFNNDNLLLNLTLNDNILDDVFYESEEKIIKHKLLKKYSITYPFTKFLRNNTTKIFFKTYFYIFYEF
jgi:hypothetical protein